MTNHPLEECLKQCLELKASHGDNFHWHQKWDCSHCQSRQTMEREDVFYLQGKCEECEKITDIEECNFVAVFYQNQNWSKAND